MQVTVRSLLKKPGNEKHYQDTWAPDQLDLQSDLYRLAGPLSVDFHLLNTGEYIQAEGRYGGTLSLRCVRCLTDYESPVEATLEAKFYEESQTRDPQPDEGGDREVVEEEAGVYRTEYSGETLRLDDVVRQDILLHCPMQPLCESDCEGLCPVCGANLNEGDCGHRPGESVDPRLAGLQDLDISDDH